MTHDPECLRAWPTDRYLPCICDRLARVRADERERAAERVAAAPSWKPDPIPDTLAIWLDEAVAAARGGE